MHGLGDHVWKYGILYCNKKNPSWFPIHALASFPLSVYAQIFAPAHENAAMGPANSDPCDIHQCVSIVSSRQDKNQII